MVKVAAIPVPVVGVVLNISTGIPTQWARAVISAGECGVGIKLGNVGMVTAPSKSELTGSPNSRLFYAIQKRCGVCRRVFFTYSNREEGRW